MKFHASFLSSFAAMSTLPTGGKSEVALIGRSNVGKSSLINALADRKQLAKTSATPGKTRLLNYFSVSTSGERVAGMPPSMRDFYLVDMPGYGYAKVAKA